MLKSELGLSTFFNDRKYELTEIEQCRRVNEQLKSSQMSMQERELKELVHDRYAS